MPTAPLALIAVGALSFVTPLPRAGLISLIYKIFIYKHRQRWALTPLYYWPQIKIEIASMSASPSQNLVRRLICADVIDQDPHPTSPHRGPCRFWWCWWAVGACIDCAIVPRYALVLWVYIADRALPVCTGAQYHVRAVDNISRCFIGRFSSDDTDVLDVADSACCLWRAHSCQARISKEQAYQGNEG